MIRKVIFITLFFSIALLFVPISTNATSKTFIDMPNDWSTVALENAVANGLLKGDEGKIKANKKITRAEVSAIISRSFGSKNMASLEDYEDIKPEDWYYFDMAKAVKMGLFEDKENDLNPNAFMTREEVFTVITKVMKLELNDVIPENFIDIDEVSNEMKAEVLALVNYGYIKGSNGRLNPKSYITRAEFAQLMDNLIKKYINKPGKQSIQIKGNVMINTPSVTLKDSLIVGDLIIGDGVGNGEVVLDNLELSGRLIVRGGGENSIVISGNSVLGSITIAKIDGKLRVYSEEGSIVGETIVDGHDDVILEGNFDNINILASDVTINISKAEVMNLTMLGKASEINIDQTTKIGSLKIMGQNNTLDINGDVKQVETSPSSVGSEVIVNDTGKVDKIIVNSEDSTISGDGEIEAVFANANHIIIKNNTAKVTVDSGIDGTMIGNEFVEPGQTYETENNNKKDSDDNRNSTKEKISDINIATDAVDEQNVLNSDSVEITLETSTVGVTIHYTLDGSSPSRSIDGETKLYNPTSKISIQTDNIFGESITLKARAFKSGMLDSDVAEKSINFNAASTVNISTAEELKKAIESQTVHTVILTSNITGDISAIRSSSDSLNIDFDNKTMTGNLSIEANYLTSLTFNGDARPSITGSLLVNAGAATVTNHINVGGNLTISDVNNNSWIEEADGNSIILTDNNGGSILINGHPNNIKISNIAGENIHLTTNTPVPIIIDSGSIIDDITVSGTAAGTSIINNGRIINIIANADITIENNNGDILVTGPGVVAVTGTASQNVTGGTVVLGLTDLEIDVAELRIGSVTEAHITTSVFGSSYNVISANATIISINDSTGLGITANKPGRVAVTVQVKNAENNVTHQGIIFITVLPELISNAEIVMTAPVLGVIPQTSEEIEMATGNPDYTVTNVTWNEPLTSEGKFKAQENYTATITLVSKNSKAFQMDAFIPSLIGSESVGTTTTISNDVGNKAIFTVTFPETGSLELTSIEITTQPTKMSYVESLDDTLSLAGMVITETNNDGSKNIVTFTDGTALGYTANPSNGSLLTKSEFNGQPVIITHTASNKTANTEDLIVTMAASFQRIIEIDHQVKIPIDKNTGLSTGSREYTPFTVTTEIGVETPSYYEMLNTGEKTDYSINYYRVNNEGLEELYFSIQLKNAMIVEIQQNKLNVLLEDNQDYSDMIMISLSYSDITWIDHLNGSVYSDSW